MKRKSILLLLLVFLLSAVPVSAATAIAPGIVVSIKKGSSEWDFGMGLGLAGSTKLASATGTATLFLPTELFIKKNCFCVNLQLDLMDPSIKDGDNYVGSLPSDDIIIYISNSGKISFIRRRSTDGKKIAMGSVTVTSKKDSSGKFYVIDIKNMPYYNKYYPNGVEWRPENLADLNTNKNYKLNTKISVSSYGNKVNQKVDSRIYLVAYSLKTSAKTIKSNFTGNFIDFFSWSWVEGTEGKPTRKIANVKY